MLSQDLLFSYYSGYFQLSSYKKLLLEVMTTRANPFRQHNIKAFYLSNTEDPTYIPVQKLLLIYWTKTCLLRHAAVITCDVYTKLIRK